MATAAARQPTGEITTLLGRGATFDGKLTFEGTVRIDGKFKGEVLSDGTLVVGEGAHVEAKIEVGEIIIHGTIDGNIKATRAIEIRAPGRVRGDLNTPTLQIEKGVIFDGRSIMESTVAPPPRAYERPASQPAAAPPTPPKPTPIK
ncbi:MAG: polymer-forming cytoskeletal protein [Kofleriaceae bacterium]